MFLFAFALAVICAALVTGCTISNPKSEIDALRLPAFIAPNGSSIEEFYEEPDGLHVTTKRWIDGQVEYGDILIELEDEQEKYTFAVDGREYEILFMRAGGPREGITAVYVVLFDQIYSIDSHRISKPRPSGMRTLRN